MKKLLIFHPVNDFTGSTRVLSNIITKEHNNKSVTIITIDEKGFLSKLPNVKIIPILILPNNHFKIKYIRYFIEKIYLILISLFYGIQHKHIYINTILPYHGACVAKLLRKKLTYHIHEYFLIKDKRVKIAEYIFNHIKSNRIFVSKYVKNCYKEKNDCPYIIKYNTLSDIFLKQISYRPLEIRRRNTITMLTSLSPFKGISLFISCAKSLPQYKFQLIISNNEEKIQQFIKNELILERLPNNLYIFPSQSNIHPFLNETDLLLNLTNPQYCIETFGMTILEAISYGIPAIVPNIGGPIEIIENSYNGYCIDVSNKELVINKINDILTNTELYNELSNNALKVFNKKFNK